MMTTLLYLAKLTINKMGRVFSYQQMSIFMANRDKLSELGIRINLTENR
jgi:hypothetical protein